MSSNIFESDSFNRRIVEKLAEYRDRLQCDEVSMWKQIALELSHDWELDCNDHRWQDLSRYFKRSLVFKLSHRKFTGDQGLIDRLQYPYLRKVYVVTIKFYERDHPSEESGAGKSRNSGEIEDNKLFIKYSMDGRYDPDVVAAFRRRSRKGMRIYVNINVADAAYNLPEDVKKLLLQMEHHRKERPHRQTEAANRDERESSPVVLDGVPVAIEDGSLREKEFSARDLLEKESFSVNTQEYDNIIKESLEREPKRRRAESFDPECVEIWLESNEMLSSSSSMVVGQEDPLHMTGRSGTQRLDQSKNDVADNFVSESPCTPSSGEVGQSSGHQVEVVRSQPPTLIMASLPKDAMTAAATQESVRIKQEDVEEENKVFDKPMECNSRPGGFPPDFFSDHSSDDEEELSDEVPATNVAELSRNSRDSPAAPMVQPLIIISQPDDDMAAAATQELIRVKQEPLEEDVTVAEKPVECNSKSDGFPQNFFSDHSSDDEEEPSKDLSEVSRNGRDLPIAPKELRIDEQEMTKAMPESVTIPKEVPFACRSEASHVPQTNGFPTCIFSDSDSDSDEDRPCSAEGQSGPDPPWTVCVPQNSQVSAADVINISIASAKSQSSRNSSATDDSNNPTAKVKGKTGSKASEFVGQAMPACVVQSEVGSIMETEDSEDGGPNQIHITQPRSEKSTQTAMERPVLLNINSRSSIPLFNNSLESVPLHCILKQRRRIPLADVDQNVPLCEERFPNDAFLVGSVSGKPNRDRSVCPAPLELSADMDSTDSTKNSSDQLTRPVMTISRTSEQEDLDNSMEISDHSLMERYEISLHFESQSPNRQVYMNDLQAAHFKPPQPNVSVANLKNEPVPAIITATASRKGQENCDCATAREINLRSDSRSNRSSASTDSGRLVMNLSSGSVTTKISKEPPPTPSTITPKFQQEHASLLPTIESRLRFQVVLRSRWPELFSKRGTFCDFFELLSILAVNLFPRMQPTDLSRVVVLHRMFSAIAERIVFGACLETDLQQSAKPSEVVSVAAEKAKSLCDSQSSVEDHCSGETAGIDAELPQNITSNQNSATTSTVPTIEISDDSDTGDLPVRRKRKYRVHQQRNVDSKTVNTVPRPKGFQQH